MILRFRHKGLERFFRTGKTTGIQARHKTRLARLLAQLDASSEAVGMDLPGFALHALGGNGKGQWAVSVSGNWRLVFGFDGQDAVDVDLVDYH